MKKLEIQKTKPSFINSTFKTDIIKVGLVFSISEFFITKTSLTNKWKRKKRYLLAVIQLYKLKPIGKWGKILVMAMGFVNHLGHKSWRKTFVKNPIAGTLCIKSITECYQPNFSPRSWVLL